MLVRFTVVTFFFLFCLNVFSQHLIQGKLLKKTDNTPIAYANIGIPDSPTGTISNPDGSFEIKIPEKYLQESLLFSALGFQRKSFKIENLLKQEQVTVYLSEESTLLKDVVVSARKIFRRSVEMGNRDWTGGSIYTDTAASGSALALLVENKYPTHYIDFYPPYYVRKTKVRISKNTFDEFKLRVRILEKDSASGSPGKDLLHESVVVSSKMPKGWLEVDLSPYNVRVDGNAFFVVYEWIIDHEDRHMLAEQYREFRRLFPEKYSVDTVLTDEGKIVYNTWQGFAPGTSLGTSLNRFALDHFKSYYRSNSHGAWKRAHAPLAARVTVSNYPFSSRRASKFQKSIPRKTADSTAAVIDF